MSDSQKVNLLNLAEKYEKRLNIDWNKIYIKNNYKKISLPTYQFESLKCWDKPRNYINKKSTSPQQIVEYEREKSVLSRQENNTPLNTDKSSTIIIFSRRDDLYIELLDACNKVKEKSSVVILVKPGTSFRQLGDNIFQIRPAHYLDYKDLFRALNFHLANPTTILNFWNHDCEKLDLFCHNNIYQQLKDLRTNLHTGINSIDLMVKALLAGNNVKDRDVHLLNFLYDSKDEFQFQNLITNNFTDNIDLLHKQIRIKNIQIEQRFLDVGKLLRLVNFEANFPDSIHEKRIFYHWNQGKSDFERILPAIKEESSTERKISIVENSTYLIVNDTQCIGAYLAITMVEKYNCKVILFGENFHDHEIDKKIRSLNSTGLKLMFFPGAICSHKNMETNFGKISLYADEIRGVIHLLNKNIKQDYQQSVIGITLMDYFTKDLPLDFYLFISSSLKENEYEIQRSSNISDYFIRSYSDLRNSKNIERPGKTYFRQWVLSNSEENMSSIISSMTESNFTASETIVKRGKKTTNTLKNENTDELVNQLLEKDIVKLISETLKVDVNDIDTDAHIEVFGFNSINILGIVNQINSKFDINLMPITFFEYQSLGDFIQFLSREFLDDFIKTYQLNKHNSIYSEVSGSKYFDKESKESKNLPKSTTPPQAEGNAPDRDSNNSTEPIAIVGMSCRMPQSDDIDQFWQQIKEGKNLVTKIPKNRWNSDAIFGDPANEANKTNVIYGGFINDIDKFDAAFFGISPREASLMDPQQRLLLEGVWTCIEDAGYKASAFSGTNTGCFMGVSNMDYYGLINELGVDIDAYTSTGTAHSITSNRISYLLNLRGPSESVDTACSSSLVALHHAIKSLGSGDCDMAFAGGANAILKQLLHISFSKAGMLNPEGKCKTFDKDANGYVRGEGVGVILLKKLNKALHDRDHIYGVIKGSAVNHGGRSNSLTAPNPTAQAELIVKAYEGAGVDPSTISYIEAHGTGTSLGDPIEVNGLKKAFKTLYEKKGRPMPESKHCGLGSVKTNIGHLEFGAGIAGVIKVLLSMKYKTIPGNIHFDELNPYIKLDDSPFFIETKTRPWHSLQNEKGQIVPRRAGVSSFGFGGSNAHVLLEEYEGDKEIVNNKKEKEKIIVLSARNEKQLKEYALKMAYFIDSKINTKEGRHECEEILLSDFAYTLQIGREGFNERLAFVANSFEEIKDRFIRFANDEDHARDLYAGRIKKKTVKKDELNKNTEDIQKLINEDDFSALAKLWVNGAEINWESLYEDHMPSRVSIPSYPFDRKSYWIPKGSIEDQVNRNILNISLHKDSEIDSEFTIALSGKEFYLEDHIVQGKKVLPGVVYLEMILEANDLSSKKQIKCIRNIVWASPITLDDKPEEITLLFHKSEQSAKFEVTSKITDGSSRVHAQGEIEYEVGQAGHPSEFIDINKVINRCNFTVDRNECYEIFKTVGLNYGSNFQVIKKLHYNENEAISILELPTINNVDPTDSFLDPRLMDGLLQTVSGLTNISKSNSTDLHLPFAIKEIRIFKALPQTCYAYATPSGTSDLSSQIRKFDLMLFDSTGNCLVTLEEFSVRILKSKEESSVLYCRNVWEERKLKVDRDSRDINDMSLVIFDSNKKVCNSLKKSLEKSGFNIEVTLVKAGSAYRKESLHTYIINPDKFEDYQSLLDDLEKNKLLPHKVIHYWSNRSLKSANNTYLDILKYNFYSLFYLTRAFIEKDMENKINLFYIYPHQSDFSLQAAVAGFAKSVHQECPNFFYKTIRVPQKANSDESSNIIIDELLSGSADEVEVQYRDDRSRFVRHLSEFNVNTSPLEKVSLKESGVYLITGGLGKMGLIIAEYMTSQMNLNIVLTGRSQITEEKEEIISSLQMSGSEVLYIQGDISKREDVENIYEKIKLQFKKLDGIIHSAGVIKDALIYNKTTADIDTVLAPKVFGTHNLDEVFKDEHLDFFLLFSSVSSAIGNIGQSDYAYANGYMDYFASRREELRTQKMRFGKTLSINWPFWKDGGMVIDESMQKLIEQTMGLKALQTEDGLNIFMTALQSKESQIIIFNGNAQKIREKILNSKKTIVKTTNTPATKSPVKMNVSSGNEMGNDLLKMISLTLGVDEGDIDFDEEMSSYGFDSITLTEFTNKINEKYGIDITPPVLFEHPSVASLSKYLYESYKDECGRYYQGGCRDEAETIVVEQGKTIQETADFLGDEAIVKKVQSNLLKTISETLAVDEGDIDLDEEMSNYGFDSITLTEFANKINDRYRVDITPPVLFEHPSVASLADYLYENYKEEFIRYYQNQPIDFRDGELETVVHKKNWDKGDLAESVQSTLVKLISTTLGVDACDIDLEEDMSAYGFDSITLTEFANNINDKYSIDVTPPVFFEYPSVISLANYLLDTYQEKISHLYDDNHLKTDNAAISDRESETMGFFQKDHHHLSPDPKTIENKNKPIAIIGMSGIMPQSEDLETYWKNLEEGNDLITEIPEERWNWKSIYGDPSFDRNKTNIKWGGFIKNVDKFDAAFFGISPEEASVMDPQQRIYLETVWKCIEDAGYNVNELSNTNTALYVGISSFDYQEYYREHDMEIEAYAAIGMSHSIVANRISYLLNLRGPSAAVDTACSSSLVAIHQAVQSIRNDECEMAIAGGVNVILTPTLHIAFSRGQMLSIDGKCKTFDEKANGYVRSEGAGAILLKSLDKAIEDNDNIYAVIKGSAVNHGGHANSLTAPNPNAQSDVIIKAYENAQIDPSTVSYVEAHGTGTSLGDPIEVNGLKKAFSYFNGKNGKTGPVKAHCGLGSVKTNIGHLEAAAGIASIIKVILSMKNKKIPATIHIEKENPYIQLDDSDLFIVKKTIPWERSDSNEMAINPRRAGVSAFGYGGTNAHVLLEDYNFSNTNDHLTPSERYIIVLSAKTEERLYEYILRLQNYIEREKRKLNGLSYIALRDIAYTLQVGRIPLDVRLMVVVKDMDDLSSKLSNYLENSSAKIKDLYRGTILKDKRIMSDVLFDDDNGKSYIQGLINQKNLTKLGKLWVCGIDIDWSLFYSEGTPNRVSIPSYPFERKRHWINRPKIKNNLYVVPEENDCLNHSIPFKVNNTSTLNNYQFTVILNGDEFYLSDHKVNNQKVLPGVVYLEMVRVIAEMIGKKNVSTIENITWAKPIQLIDKVKEVYINLHQDGQHLNYEFTTNQGDDKFATHSSGTVVFNNPEKFPVEPCILDISAIQARCKSELNSLVCYELFNESGLKYGKNFQVIKKINYNDTEVISCLQLSHENVTGFKLHPALLDGALQTIIGFMEKGSAKDLLYLPFSLGRMDIYQSIPSKCYVYAKKGASDIDMKYSVQIVDEKGNELVRMVDFFPIAIKKSDFINLTALSDDVARPESIEAPRNEDANDSLLNIGSVHDSFSSNNAIKTIEILDFEIKEIISKVLNIEPDKIDVNKPFENYGMDSLMTMKILRKIERKLKLKVSADEFFKFPELKSLTEYLFETHFNTVTDNEKNEDRDTFMDSSDSFNVAFNADRLSEKELDLILEKKLSA